MHPRPLSRRAALAGAAAFTALSGAALSGCTAGEPEPTPTPAPDPEHVMLREVIAEKERTIGLYGALIDQGAEELGSFRDRHQAHLDELRSRLPAAPAPSVTDSPVPATATAAKPSASPEVPAKKISLPRLRDLERKAAALRTRQVALVSPALSQLLASIGACEAAHALALPRSA